MLFQADQYWQVQAQMGAAFFANSSPQYTSSTWWVLPAVCGKNGWMDAIRLSAVSPGVMKLSMMEIEQADKDGSTTPLAGIERAAVLWMMRSYSRATVGCIYEGHTLC